MSVTSVSLITEQAGNGVQVAFTFAFKILASTDLIVRKKAADGTYGAVLTINSDYTVAFDPDAETGTVTYTVAPVSGGASNISRKSNLQQSTVLPRETVLVEKKIETGLDKVTLQIQEVKEQVGRALTQPIVPPNPGAIIVTAPTDARALKYHDNGDGTWNVAPSTYDPDAQVAAAAASAAAAAASAVSAAASAASFFAAYKTGTFATLDAGAAATAFVAYVTDYKQWMGYCGDRTVGNNGWVAFGGG